MTIPDKPVVTIAIIGGGGLIGPRHAQSVIQSQNATLTALVDPAAHGPEIAKTLGCAHFNSIPELLDSPQRPTAAIVCTPNHTHVELSKLLISAGVHVLVEKPISTSIESGLDLISSAKAHGIHLLAGHHRRFNPYITATKAALEQNSLGRVLAISGVWSNLKDKEYFEPPMQWHQGKQAGVILINLVHDIDLLQYLLGPISKVHAEKTIKTRPFEADEGAAVILKFRNGVVGTFLISDCCPAPWSMEAGTGENPMIPRVDVETGAGGFYRIFGTEASLSVPDMTRWSYDGSVQKSWRETLSTNQLHVVIDQVPFDEQVEHFVRVLEGREDPVCSGEEGLSALVVCEAIQKAMETGDPVSI